MKKLFLLLISCFLLTGCLSKDSMEDIEIYVAYYPIEYITNTLYKDHATIYSIYPDGSDIYNFTLTNKQIKNYSTSDLFIYDGYGTQRDYAVKMLDYNKKIKIIDSTKGVTYDDNIEALWLNPGNMLMVCQNIRKGFEEYITNPYLLKEVEENYNELKVKISELDVELKSITEGKSNSTIIVSNDLFKFLEKYNFNVISLEQNENLTEKTIDDVKKLIKNGTIKYIYLIDGEETSDTIKDIINETKVNTLKLNTISTITTKQRQDNQDYLTIMNENIQSLKKGFN